MLHHYENKKGFTLAEVLITLGIIGIVVAMTLPSLINHYRDRQIVSQFNTAVSIFSNAFTRMANDNGGQLTNLYGPWNDFRHLDQDFYAHYFKLVKMCIPYGSYKDCIPYNIYQLNKTLLNGAGDVCGTYKHIGILENGMIFCFGIPAGRADGWEDRIQLEVDLNGAKGPNTLGYDIFTFFISNAGIVRPSLLYSSDSCDIKGAGRSGYRCSEWVQKYQNVDYLYHSYPNSSSMWK